MIVNFLGLGLEVQGLEVSGLDKQDCQLEGIYVERGLA